MAKLYGFIIGVSYVHSNGTLYNIFLADQEVLHIKGQEARSMYQTGVINSF